MAFKEIQHTRRSIYNLGKELSQTPQELTEMIEDAIREAPTAMNSQTTRAVILYGKAHDRLWEIVFDRLKQEVPNEAAYERTKSKVEGSFKAGFGTVLFYLDTDVIESDKEKFTLYADNIETWAEQGLGINNYAVWTRLSDNQIGASLQHYNPIIDELVAKEFGIPDNWKLRSQMPFGSIQAPADDKTYIDDQLRFKVIGD